MEKIKLTYAKKIFTVSIFFCKPVITYICTTKQQACRYEGYIINSSLKCQCDKLLNANLLCIKRPMQNKERNWVFTS